MTRAAMTSGATARRRLIPGCRRLAREARATTAVEFAICALAMVLLVVGFVEFGRVAWTFEVLQESAFEGARCMGLRSQSCVAGGVYNATDTRNYVISVATARGVALTAGTITLSNTATCGGVAGFSQVSINYDFTSVAPQLVTSLIRGFNVPTSACFPNNS
jgi:Flp pilus assembly protein TadG